MQGDLKGPLMPALLAKGEGWSGRPITSVEVTKMLKVFFDCKNDMALTSHSLKSTLLLSWCAKGSVSKEHRRLLGRHSTAVVDADSIYI